MKTITLNEDQLGSLLGEETVKGYEDFLAEADHESGDFDSEKGAMYDYKITLVNQKTGEVYTARDGYYTGVTGDCFYGDVVFTLKPKKKKAVKKPMSKTDVRKSLQSLINRAGIENVKEAIKELA